MAFVTLIIAPGRGVVEIDALTQVTHQADVEVTEHPVEVGANISDHARLKPETVTLVGLVSNTSIGTQIRRTISVDGGIDFTSSVLENVPAGAPGRAEESYAKLRAIKDARQFVQVLTELRTYKNMMLISLTVPREPTTGDALRFTAVFKEIQQATLQTKDVKVARAKKKKTGAQATPTASKDDTDRSSLHRLAHDTETGSRAHSFLLPPVVSTLPPGAAPRF